VRGRGGAGDCAANAVGTGVVKSGILSTSIGTSGVMFVHADQMQVDPQGRLHTFCHAVRGKWHMMGVTLAGRRLAAVVCRADMRRARREGEAESLRHADPGGRSRSPRQRRIVLPAVPLGRADAARRSAGSRIFVGLTMSHGRGHMARSIMEGVAYSLRESLDIIRGLGVPVKEIRASGGGGKSPLWRQIQADVFGQDVVTINAEQGPAYGVALLAAVGAGAFKTVEEACAATIRVVSRTPCDKKAAKVYDRVFPIYQQLYPALQASFRAIGSV
jgi:xylulokinase